MFVHADVDARTCRHKRANMRT